MADTPKDPTPEAADTPAPVFHSPEDMIAYLEKRYFVLHKGSFRIWGSVLLAAVVLATGLTLWEIPARAKRNADQAAKAAVKTELQNATASLESDASEAVKNAINDQIVNEMDEKFVKPTQATLEIRLESWARRTALDVVEQWTTDDGQKAALQELVRIQNDARIRYDEIQKIEADLGDTLQGRVAALESQPRLVSVGHVYFEDGGQSTNIGVPVEVGYEPGGIYTLTLPAGVGASALPVLVATPDWKDKGHDVLVNWTRMPDGRFRFQVKARKPDGGPGITGFTYAIFDKPLARITAGGGS